MATPGSPASSGSCMQIHLHLHLPLAQLERFYYYRMIWTSARSYKGNTCCICLLLHPLISHYSCRAPATPSLLYLLVNSVPIKACWDFDVQQVCVCIIMCGCVGVHARVPMSVLCVHVCTLYHSPKQVNFLCDESDNCGKRVSH